MSSIFEGPLTTPEALEIFSERNFLEAMLRFEASLARAQATVGLIPEAAAQSIAGTCKVELFDVAKIVRESGRAGSISVALVKSLRETVGLFNKEAAGFVHFGASSQDVVDTALALVTRRAVGLIEVDIHKALAALLALASHHAADPMLTRMLMQPASVTSFGLKCAAWAAPLLRSLQRLQTAAGHALGVQLGAAAGTMAQMQGKGPQVLALMAADLQLNAPPFAWSVQRDEWVALGCELGLLVGSFGKIARDISLMSQYEVAEVSESPEPGRSAVACMVALAAAQRAPHRVAALLSAMPQEHEQALGNWQAELAEWPVLLMSAHGAARAMALALPGLQVNVQRMRANLEAVRDAVSAEDAARWFNPGLALHAVETVRAQIGILAAELATLNTADETGGMGGAKVAP